MTQSNKRVSIATRAKRSSGSVRCTKCEFYNRCRVSRYMVNVCNAIYIKAYIKGYKQSTKDHKNDHIINW